MVATHSSKSQRKKTNFIFSIWKKGGASRNNVVNLLWITFAVIFFTEIFERVKFIDFAFTNNFPFNNSLAGNYTLIQLLIMLIFCILETLLPNAGPKKTAKSFILNLKVYVFNFLWVPLAGILFAEVFTKLSSTLGLGFINLTFMKAWGWPGLSLEFMISFFVFDFFYYWMHRFTHENVWLWQQHKVHHLDKAVSAMFRDNFLEPIFEWIAITIPLSILFKFDSFNAYVFSLIVGTMIVWIHMNSRIELGWFNRVIVNPQTHRIHHSTNPEKFMSNYATYFPIWDILFGTYNHPKKGEWGETGVEDQPDFETWSDAQSYPVKQWRKMIKSKRLNKNNKLDKDKFW